MFNSQSLNFESILLQNRLGRLVDIEVCCFANRDRRVVILKAPHGAASVMIGKSIDHFAFQLCQKLRVDGEQIVFLQAITDDESWLRWSFQWSGNSPLCSRSEPVSLVARQKILASYLHRELVPMRLCAVADVA